MAKQHKNDTKTEIIEKECTDTYFNDINEYINSFE